MRRSFLLVVCAVLCFALSLSLLSSPVSAAGSPPPGCSAASGTCIRIGVYTCASNCVLITGQNEMINWYENYVDTTLGGMFNGVPVYFIKAPLAGNAGTPADIITKTHNIFIGQTPELGTLVDFVLLPAGSNWAGSVFYGGSHNNAMALLEKWKIPAIAANSPASTLYKCPPAGTTTGINTTWIPCFGKPADSRRFQYAHGISSAGELYFQAWIGLMKLKKAKSIGIISVSAGFFPQVLKGTQLSAADYNIPVIYDQVAQTVNGTIQPAEISRRVREVAAANPDGIVLAAQDCTPWIKEFYAQDYVPKSLATVLCTDNTDKFNLLSDALIYVAGSAQWSPDMNGNDYAELLSDAPWSMFSRGGQFGNMTSPLLFQKVWREAVNRPDSVPGYAEGTLLAGFTMLQGAIHLAHLEGSVHPDAVNTQLQQYYQPSYFGLLSTNKYGLNQQKQIVINQRDADGRLQIISPPSSATMDFIYPMPPFSERSYTAVLLTTPVEFVVIALMCLCIAFTGSLMAYLFAHRKEQVFQAAGLPFYLMMGLGCCVAFGSVLVWGVENNDETCRARIWLWTLGFHMFVDPLLASSWRISRIFSQKLQTVKLTNRTVGLVSLALVTPQLIINALWAGLAPLEPLIVSEIPLRPKNTSYTTCSAGDNGVIFAGVTLGYSAFLLLSACYLAYKVRKAYRMFNDARPIAVCMYIFTITAAIILVIQIALDAPTVNSQKVLFGLRSIGVLIAYQSSIALLYFRRILGQNEGVTKYGKGAKGMPHDSSSTSAGDTSAKPATKSNPQLGDKMFAKGGDHSNGSRPDQNSKIRNVHVHIQPPTQYANNGSPKSGSPDGTSPMGVATPTGQLGFSPGKGPIGSQGKNGLTGSPSRSAGTTAGVGVSQLALADLSRTPLGGPSRGSPAVRPERLQPHIVQIPAAIPLPSQSELLAMEPAQLAQLVQQFHAQNQVLRSQIRGQNLAAAAAGRGEPSSPGMWATGPAASRQTSLPGTPDRSPRHGQSASPAEDSSRRGSVQQTVQLNGVPALGLGAGIGGGQYPPGGHPTTAVAESEMVVIRPYGSSTPLAASGDEQPRLVGAHSLSGNDSSDASKGGNGAPHSRASTGSDASHGSNVTPTHNTQTTAAGISMEMSPVDELGPMSVSSKAT